MKTQVITYSEQSDIIFGIDFDGTIVEHEYPNIGPAVSHAIDTMKELQQKGHKLILWTMRSDEYLGEAVKYVEKQGITLFGVNTNHEQKEWTNSPKAYCQMYIDDVVLGCSLIQCGVAKRPFVDWKNVRELLVDYGGFCNY